MKKKKTRVNDADRRIFHRFPYGSRGLAINYSTGTGSAGKSLTWRHRGARRLAQPPRVGRGGGGGGGPSAVH